MPKMKTPTPSHLNDAVSSMHDYMECKCDVTNREDKKENKKKQGKSKRTRARGQESPSYLPHWGQHPYTHVF